MYILDYNENSTAQYMFLMRDEKEERKKQARSNKQTRQSNTAHPHVQKKGTKVQTLGASTLAGAWCMVVSRSHTLLLAQRGSGLMQ